MQRSEIIQSGTIRQVRVSKLFHARSLVDYLPPVEIQSH
jgi:hypothetical protein